MNILLVDDDRDSVKSVKRFLTRIGHQVTECNSAGNALEALPGFRYPLVISDIKMPGMSGLELLQEIKSRPGGGETEVVLFTGYGNMDTAIQALRLGAYDYLLKPINVEELAILVERVAERQILIRENRALNEEMDDRVRQATAETKQELESLRRMMGSRLGMLNLVFSSQEMQNICEQAMKYHTDRSIPVLIEGETGVGKEIIAKLIHYGQMKSLAPFTDLNCATLKPSLFETELFGYDAGAFTGALAKGQKGKLDVSNGGTLFLDEIGDLPLELQGKLLRVIQEKEYYRIGGLKKIRTDVRLICATNVNLEAEVRQGNFRKDLFYRLNVGRIVIPPLRERRDDILPLARSLIAEFAAARGKRFKSIGEGAARLLLEHSWPGNVRELRNIMEWISFMYDDVEVKPVHLADILKNTTGDDRQVSLGAHCEISQGFSLPREGLALNKFVDQIILEALKLHHGNKTDTARFLGISRKSLYCHLEGMERKR